MDRPLRHYAEAFSSLNGAAKRVTMRLGTFALLDEYPSLTSSITEVYKVCDSQIPVDDLAKLNRIKDGMFQHPSFTPKLDESHIASIYQNVNERIADIENAGYISDYISAELEANKVIDYLNADQPWHIENASNLLLAARSIGHKAHELTRSYDLYC